MIEWLLSLWFRWKGWKIKGRFPHEVSKMIIAVGPHTSAWDVVVGLSVRHLKKNYLTGLLAGSSVHWAAHRLTGFQKQEWCSR
jgi:1-acyl-sn-glycerol-3-phosphate acyltransferase